MAQISIQLDEDDLVEPPEIPFEHTQSTGSQAGTPWEFFGVFENNPEWGAIFDEIEQRQNRDKS